VPVCSKAVILLALITVYAHSDANTSANAEIWIQKGITISDTNLPTIAITSNVSKLKAGTHGT
jgi:hypothetical protein